MSSATSSQLNHGGRRTRARSSLLAQGEPMVWLTGGALVMAVLMIVGLLGLVFYFGLSTFWPMPVRQVETWDGKVYMGEITRSEYYRPESSYADELPESVPADIRAGVVKTLADPDAGTIRRRLFRTGNFRLTQQHFKWVEDPLVKKVRYPDWAMVIERLEWGRFYGTPLAFARVNRIPQKSEDGRARSAEEIREEARRQIKGFAVATGEEPALVVNTYAAGRRQDVVKPVDQLEKASDIVGVARLYRGPEVAWEKFNEHHVDVRKQWRKRRGLEKHAIGKMNQRQEEARLSVRAAHLAMESEQTTAGQSSETFRTAQEAYAAAVANEEQVREETATEYQQIRREIKRINDDNGRYRLLMQTAGEGTTPAQTTLMSLDEVVRAYPANALSVPDKLGIYFSRWGEFLADEPREANSEGGVYPAIFGTVVMTFIMIIVVVPFGVLASLYLREYAKAGPIVSAVRIAVNNLAGVPSIVFGVFGLGFFCYGVGSYIDGGSAGSLGKTSWTVMLIVWLAALVGGLFFWTGALSRVNWKSSWQLRYFKGLFITVWIGALLAVGFVLVAEIPGFDGFHRARLPNPTFGKGGLLWASLTLALLTLPVVIVATEEALSAVPNSMREGSYACGASKWQTIKRIVLPRAMPGIMTGAVLAMARGAGEVAPLMLVGAVKLAPELPVDSLFPYLHPERSFMHLGFHIYDVGFQSQNSEAAKPMVYTTTMLLILLVVLMNVAAIYLRNRLRRKFVAQAF